jgi:hypothetical protein
MVQFNRNQQIQDVQDWIDELQFYPLPTRIAMMAFRPHDE